MVDSAQVTTPRPDAQVSNLECKVQGILGDT